MSRRDTVQLNIRSAFARARVAEIARRTGMTATQIVEDALRGYVAPADIHQVGLLERHGPILVHPGHGARPITLEEAEAALLAVRERTP